MTQVREGIALVLNCGSSSIKYQVVDTSKPEPLAERKAAHTARILALEARQNVGAAVGAKPPRKVGPLPCLTPRSRASTL